MTVCTPFAINAIMSDSEFSSKFSLLVSYRSLYALGSFIKMSDSSSMCLQHTLFHHKSHVNAIAINSECDRLLSGGKNSARWMRGRASADLRILGDDAELVVCNLSTGEMMQVIHCACFGAVGAIVWLPKVADLSHGFAFGCADGSVHIYTRDDDTVGLADFELCCLADYLASAGTIYILRSRRST